LRAGQRGQEPQCVDSVVAICSLSCEVYVATGHRLRGASGIQRLHDVVADSTFHRIDPNRPMHFDDLGTSGGRPVLLRNALAAPDFLSKVRTDCRGVEVDSAWIWPALLHHARRLASDAR
jgi:hypothetical protein